MPFGNFPRVRTPHTPRLSLIGSWTSNGPTVVCAHTTTTHQPASYEFLSFLFVCFFHLDCQNQFRFPLLSTAYGHWWWNLVRNDPIHVLVETTLIVSILYILVARSQDWKETEEHLSVKEEEELLREWKMHGRASLTPSLEGAPSTTTTTTTTKGGTISNSAAAATNATVPGANRGSSSKDTSTSSTSTTPRSAPYSLVVHKVHGAYMDITMDRDAEDAHSTPTSTSATTTTALSNSKGTKTGGPSSTRSKFLSHKQQQQQQSQQPPSNNTNNHKEHLLTVLNFSTFDYLGMSSNQPSVRQAADRALNIYGCGSCGPRGFYGTIDAHLQLEQEFSQFLGVDGAILYSDGASTCASTIAAFCKRGDLIVCDEGIYEPLRTGVTLSRAHLKWFKHNDMQDLRRVLTSIQEHDAQVKRPINAQRRFLVVEGLYRTTGSIVPLKELVALKHEFSYRLILDESNSFGTLGATGRGVHELFQCRLMHDVEITTIALENSMGAIGGITVGSEEVVEHQRLSGSGYCFSASSPPFTATAAMQSLKLLRESPDTTLHPLQDNIAYMYYKLTQLCQEQLDDVLLVTSAPNSPILLLQVADIPETRDLEEVLFLQEVVQECLWLQPRPASTSAWTATLTTPPSSAGAASTTTSASGGGAGANTSNPSSLTTASSNNTANNLNTTAGSSTLASSDALASSAAASLSSSSSSTTTAVARMGGMVVMAVQSPPGIRITVSAAHSHEQLDQCLHLLTESVEIVLGRMSQC